MIAFSERQEGLDAEALLGPQGRAAQCWPAFESRPQQLQMARRAQSAFREHFHLAAEAGTGVGKSFAYLTAAVDVALRKAGRVVISTYTVNLQQQLIQKDILLLASLMDEALLPVWPKAAATTSASGDWTMPSSGSTPSLTTAAWN